MRTYCSTLVTGLLLMVLSAIPQWAYAQKKLEDMIRALDRQRLEAQVSKDTVFLQKVLASDLIYHHSSGFAETKQEFIHHIAIRRWNYTSIDVEEATVRVYGNTAVVTGKLRMVLLDDDKPTPYHLLYTDVYVKHRWLWQLASWSATPVSKP